jgi:D-alanyl-D-alanine carboxypeptidase
LVVGTASPANADDDTRQAAMDAAVQAGIPGMLAVASDWRGTSGVGDVRTQQKPDTSGRVRIGSVSKTFVATMVLKQVAAGRVRLDAPISTYLPGLLPYPEPITVRQLLQHTSGLPRDLAAQYTWTTLEELDTERFVHFGEVEAIHDSTVQPLLFPPGTNWSYSNTGYNVLALLVEKITHKPLERVLAETITGPLHMRDTLLPRDFPFLLDKATHGYEQLYPGKPLTDVTTYNLTRYFGAGDVVSSAADLNRFFHALLGGQLLPADLMAQMKTTVPARNPDGTYPGFDYGLGLMRVSLARICGGTGPDVWGHGGDVPGFNTWSMHLEDGSKQITTSANQDLTASLTATTRRVLVMVNEYCTPVLPTTPLAAAKLN